MFALTAGAMLFFSWLGNVFYYDNGTPPPSEERLNRMMVFDVVLIGGPLFFSGLFFGLGINRNHEPE